MKIIGEEYFINNTYDFVFINENEIIFSGECQTNKVNNSIFSNFDRNEIILIVIKKFLESNKINSVSYGISINDKVERNIIETVNNSKLIIDLKLPLDILNLIKYKYYLDMKGVVENAFYDDVELIPSIKTSSKYKNCENKLKIFISRKNKEIVFDELEIDFIKYLLSTLFKDKKVSYKGLFIENKLGFYLISDSSSIKIKLTNVDNYFDFIINLIDEHNKKLNDRKYIKELKK